MSGAGIKSMIGKIASPGAVEAGLLAALMFTGFYNRYSDSWSSFFRFNLFLHPLLGFICTFNVAGRIFRRIKIDLPELKFRLLVSFTVLSVYGLLKAYISLQFPIDYQNSIAKISAIVFLALAIYVSVRAPGIISRGKMNTGTWVLLTIAVIWTASAITGSIVFFFGGDRNVFFVYPIHGVFGFIVAGVSIPFWFSAAGRIPRGRRLAAGVGGLAAIFSVIALVNAIGGVADNTDQYPRASFHLSTIPYEKREASDQDPRPQPIDVEMMDISTSCGQTYDCHPYILEDFKQSLHNVSYMTPHFQKNLQLLSEEIGRENHLLCSGCHTPLSLVEGGGEFEDYAERDNVSCVFCHSISEVGQIDRRRSMYAVELQSNHLEMFREAEKKQEAPSALGRLMIRLNSNAHGRVFTRDFYKDDSYCQACHHLQLASSGTGPTCVRCHMESRKLLGLEGDVKNHFFPGSNASLHSVLGRPDLVKLNEQYSQSRFLVRALTDVYNAGPEKFGDKDRIGRFYYIEMNSEIDGELEKGKKAKLTIFTRNAALDHAFPTSALDLAETWLHLKVTDDSGREIYSSGEVDDLGRVDPQSHRMGGYMVGHDDHIVSRNRVWQIKKKVVERRILDKETTEDVYEFEIPEQASGRLNVVAEWKYRKHGTEFWNWAYPDSITPPTLSVARIFRQYKIK